MARKSCFLLACVVLLCGSSFGRDRQANGGASAALDKTPSIAGDYFECGQMIQVVNHLRKLGKDKSIAALRNFLASDAVQANDQVLIICRLLFVNLKGWKTPHLGKPDTTINGDAVEKFPLFPIALSDRVPFILVDGYAGGGRGSSAKECLNLCGGFALVKEDYPLTGYEKAARKLTQSEAFRQLYQKADRQRMADMILRQARKPKAAEK
jgi:hypothetical protein